MQNKAKILGSVMKTNGISRRAWLAAVGADSLALSVARGQNSAAAPLASLNRFPRMVHEHFVERVRIAERAGEAARAALKTKADAEAYVQDVRRKIQLCFGPFPEKTPLNPRVTGTVERDAYTIENVIFESRPGFLVTANLYVPKGRPFPLPGVVGSCGHSDNGKAHVPYQSFCQGLARMGYVVLIFDPIGQGERVQYGHVEKPARPRVGSAEHLYAGNQQFLVGEFFGSWRAWDGIRALDYLLSRPEVDPKHIGITGNSGGGTMTTWLCGVEQRWTMAAPSCFVTTFRRNMENERPADTEQCPPRALALGLDHDDFHAALAPKPIVILAQEKDFFDARGSEEAFARLKRLYALLGAEENIKLQVGPMPHGYTQENREAMYHWFNRATQISDAQAEPKLTIEKDETLWCTPTGQVADMNSRTVFSFTAEASKRLAAGRPKLAEPDLKRAVAAALKLPRRTGAPEYRILPPDSGRKYPQPHATPYAVETEPGVFALVYRLYSERFYSRPPRGPDRAVLYVSHHSADAELRDEPLITDLMKAESGTAFYTCDVRGIGESRPDTCVCSAWRYLVHVRGIGESRPDTCGYNQFLSPYGSDFFYASHSLMLDRPYVGQKTFDVLRVLDWLASHGHKEIHLVGYGWGSIPAALAGLLADSVTQITLKHALTSYQDIAESEEYNWPLSSFVPGVLKSFDLPDCYAALLAKKLRQIEPVGPKAG